MFQLPFNKPTGDINASSQNQGHAEGPPKMILFIQTTGMNTQLGGTVKAPNIMYEYVPSSDHKELTYIYIYVYKYTPQCHVSNFEPKP